MIHRWLEPERSLAVHDRLHRLGLHFRTRERVRLVGNPVDWPPFRLLRAEQAGRHHEGGGTHLRRRRGIVIATQWVRISSPRPGTWT